MHSVWLCTIFCGQKYRQIPPAFPANLAYLLRNCANSLRTGDVGDYSSSSPSHGCCLLFIASVPGWLEPLLMRIGQNLNHVVTPVIDNIADDDMHFSWSRAADVQVGGFKWQGLTFTWHLPPHKVRQERKEKSQLADPMP